jgi:hypothetical protein
VSVLAAAWRWPNEALGRLAGSIVRRAPRRFVQLADPPVGATLVEDARFDRLFRLVPKRPSAMTLGSTVIARRPLDAALLVHELTHVAQFRRWGAAYLPLYVIGAAWGLLRHRQFYLGNPFEVRAMRAAARFASKR